MFGIVQYLYICIYSIILERGKNVDKINNFVAKEHELCIILYWTMYTPAEMATQDLRDLTIAQCAIIMTGYLCFLADIFVKVKQWTLANNSTINNEY